MIWRYGKAARYIMVWKCGGIRYLPPKSTDPVNLYSLYNYLQNVNTRHSASVQKHCGNILQLAAIQTVQMNWKCRLGRYLMCGGGDDTVTVKNSLPRAWCMYETV